MIVLDGQWHKNHINITSFFLILYGDEILYFFIIFISFIARHFLCLFSKSTSAYFQSGFAECYEACNVSF